MKEIIRIRKFGWLGNEDFFDKDLLHLLIIVLFSLLIKLLALTYFDPLIFNDSYDYLFYAKRILDLNFVSPEGLRTPGYPLFLAVAFKIFNGNLLWIALVQSMAGSITLFLIGKILFNINRKFEGKFTVLIIGFSQVSFFDLAILTESLTMFFLVLTIKNILDYISCKSNRLLIWLSLNSGFLILIRPQYFFIFLVLSIFVFFFSSKKVGVVLFFIVVLLSTGWSTINYHQHSFFGMSTYIGFNLINHTGAFIEKGNEINDTFREIYLKHRDRRYEKGMNNEFTIWEAENEIKENLEINRIQLSKLLFSESLKLILQNPIDYLMSVHSAAIYALSPTARYFHKSIKFILIPNLILMIIYITGISVMILYKKSFGENYDLIFIVLFTTNFFISVSLDIGENFRYMSPVFFIPVAYFAIFLRRSNFLIGKENKKIHP